MNKRTTKILKLILVNLITSIRLIGALSLPFIYYKNGASTVSIFIIIIFLTDFIDGFLARRLKVSTFFGSALDALSDKILNAVSLIILGLEYNIMLAPLVIEVAIIYTSYNTYRYGGNVQSSFTGKLKTAILDICVVLSFVLLALPKLNIDLNIIHTLIIYTDTIIFVLTIISLGATIAALYDYMKLNFVARLNPNSKEIKYEEKNRKPTKLLIHELFDTNYYLKHKNESIMKQLYFKKH
jgi:phosphatidylglycerophosphate synthase